MGVASCAVGPSPRKKAIVAAGCPSWPCRLGVVVAFGVTVEMHLSRFLIGEEKGSIRMRRGLIDGKIICPRANMPPVYGKDVCSGMMMMMAFL
jgi:hypothetical protein